MAKVFARTVVTSAGIALLLTACGQPVAHQAAIPPEAPAPTTVASVPSTIPATTATPTAVPAAAATGLAADIEALAGKSQA